MPETIPANISLQGNGLHELWASERMLRDVRRDAFVALPAARNAGELDAAGIMR